jgi:ATP-binding cassette, subfamily G (WHITE), member 2, SNQ2
MGAMLTFTTYDIPVNCAADEFAIFNPPPGQTCQTYLAGFMNGLGSMTNLTNPTATENCMVCEYRTGSDYLASLNLLDYSYGWRDNGILTLFVFSGYSFVYLLMKLRTKASKTAE